jgi:hypothetical protein
VPESLDLFAEVRLLRAEVEEQGSMLEALVRAQGAEVREAIVKELKADPALSGILRLVNGELSQGQIQQRLAGTGVPGASPAGVSRKMDRLKELHLVAPTRRTKEGVVYRRTSLDRVLGISKALDSK